MTCAAGEGWRFPSTYPYYLTLEKKVLGVVTKREVVKVTNRSTDTFTIVRSAGYCPWSDAATTQTNTAYAFDASDTISLRIVAENIDDINVELVRLWLVIYPDASTTVKGISKLTVDPTSTIGTATMTIANPCVVSKTSHGLIADDTVKFTTTGALPTGITSGTKYYVISTGLTANTFQLSATQGGSALITTGTQSWTHTLYKVTPIAVGTNDGRVPTQGENDAAAWSYGTPSSSNKFVTETDPLYANNVKTTGTQTIAGVKTFSSIPVLPASDPTTANEAVRKSYADGLITETTWTLTDWTATISYNKRWKLYYNLRIVDATHVQGNGYACQLFNDSNTYNRICTLLGKTYSTSTTNTHYCAGAGNALQGQWNGSIWTANGSQPAATATFLSTITTTT